MQIAVFHNLPSGGAKRALFGAVNYLLKSGHRVDVHVPSSADESYLSLKEVASGFHVYPVRRTWRGFVSSFTRYGLDPFTFMADLEWAQERIAEAINRGPYDVVFSEQDQFTMTPFLLRYLKKPTVYYCQQPSRVQEAALDKVEQSMAGLPSVPLYKKIWRVYLKSRMAGIDKANASHATYILTNSCFTRETILRAFGLNSFVSYLGVDTDLFRPLNLLRENFVLSVGACHPHKGHDFTVRSLSLIDKRIRPKLLIVGNAKLPGWPAHLEQLAARLDVDLEIRTSVPDEEIVGLYNRAKLFVYAPILEPLGLAPLEAMSCGTCVVAVKEGGPRETILHRETGILTERDEAAFAEAVEELLRDEHPRIQMGNRGAEVVRDAWTADRAGEQLLWHLNRARSAGRLPSSAETVLKVM